MKLIDLYERMIGDPCHGLDPTLEIPVLTGLQVQGDVAIIPTRPGADPGDPITPAGVPVVRGENGGNTHHLVTDGPCSWRPTIQLPELGTLTVPDGSVAWLLHPEHGGNGIGPGCYRLRRQQEMADELRMVAD